MPQAPALADKTKVGDAAVRGQHGMDAFAAAAIVLAQGAA
jgi:hypothetical protein